MIQMMNYCFIQIYFHVYLFDEVYINNINFGNEVSVLTDDNFDGYLTSDIHTGDVMDE